MATDQDTIWYLAGDDEAALRASPQLEGFRARGVEVLLLTDPIDAFWPERLTTYSGKTLSSVTQAPADKAADQAAGEASSESVRNLVAAIKTALGDAVADVRTTSRLTDSAVVLAAGAGGPDLQMQRLLRRSGRAIPTPPPVLEINPAHPAILRLAEQAETDPSRVAAAAGVLLDLARVQDGEPPRDPAAFARAITALLAGEPPSSPDAAA
jgi:molecular chaperone HtpG